MASWRDESLGDAPEPTRTSRDPARDDDVIPSSVTALIGKLGQGWAHRVTHASGVGLKGASSNGPRRYVAVDTVVLHLRNRAGLVGAWGMWGRELSVTSRKLSWTWMEGWTWVLCGHPDCHPEAEHPAFPPVPIGAFDLSVIATDTENLTLGRDAL